MEEATARQKGAYRARTSLKCRKTSPAASFFAAAASDYKNQGGGPKMDFFNTIGRNAPFGEGPLFHLVARKPPFRLRPGYAMGRRA